MRSRRGPCCHSGSTTVDRCVFVGGEQRSRWCRADLVLQSRAVLSAQKDQSPRPHPRLFPVRSSRVSDAFRYRGCCSRGTHIVLEWVGVSICLRTLGNVLSCSISWHKVTEMQSKNECGEEESCRRSVRRRVWLSTSRMMRVHKVAIVLTTQFQEYQTKEMTRCSTRWRQQFESELHSLASTERSNESVLTLDLRQKDRQQVEQRTLIWSCHSSLMIEVIRQLEYLYTVKHTPVSLALQVWLSRQPVSNTTTLSQRLQSCTHPSS